MGVDTHLRLDFTQLSQALFLSLLNARFISQKMCTGTDSRGPTMLRIRDEHGILSIVSWL